MNLFNTISAHVDRISHKFFVMKAEAKGNIVKWYSKKTGEKPGIAAKHR